MWDPRSEREWERVRPHPPYHNTTQLLPLSFSNNKKRKTNNSNLLHFHSPSPPHNIPTFFPFFYYLFSFQFFIYSFLIAIYYQHIYKPILYPLFFFFIFNQHIRHHTSILSLSRTQQILFWVLSLQNDDAQRWMDESGDERWHGGCRASVTAEAACWDQISRCIVLLGTQTTAFKIEANRFRFSLRPCCFN